MNLNDYEIFSQKPHILLLCILLVLRPINLIIHFIFKLLINDDKYIRLLIIFTVILLGVYTVCKFSIMLVNNSINLTLKLVNDNSKFFSFLFNINYILSYIVFLLSVTMLPNDLLIIFYLFMTVL